MEGDGLVERFDSGHDREPVGGVGETAPVRGGDPSLDRVARLEEMAARTHERAAELYEAWLKQKATVRSEELGLRAHRHRQLAAAARSVGHLTERTVHGFEARVQAGTPTSGKARHLVILSALQRLRRLVDTRIEECVAAGRQEGASWSEIAAALKVTRQTAHQRYRDEPR
jgi:hypothetical protein